jgi:gluconate 2-dehydrogenase gamma chain
MDRREVMRGLVAMFGAELLLPIRNAIANGMDPVNLTGGTLFSDDLRQETAALAETIIPATDTPGAREAGVARFVEFMLQEWYPADDRNRYMDGMARLAEYCATQYQRPFSKLDNPQQIKVVAGLQDGQINLFDDGGVDFFKHAKQLTIFGYYTSKIGMTVERRYLPVPGRYDGAYPYDNVRTLFTS